MGGNVEAHAEWEERLARAEAPRSDAAPKKGSPVIDRLLAAPYGHTLRRTTDGQYLTVLHLTRGDEVIIVAPTFDESATKALDIADTRRRQRPRIQWFEGSGFGG